MKVVKSIATSWRMVVVVCQAIIPFDFIKALRNRQRRWIRVRPLLNQKSGSFSVILLSCMVQCSKAITEYAVRIGTA